VSYLAFNPDKLSGPFLPADNVRTARRSKLDTVAVIRAGIHCAGIHPENVVAFESEVGDDLLYESGFFQRNGN
jgi:hypothetical protein